MSVVGRPSKKTPEREQRLLEALRAGNTRSAACHYAGIDQGTLANWQQRYSDFSDAIKKAEADAEVRHVANIAKAAQEGTWTASAWWLERRRPDDYARRDKLEHSGPDGGAIEFDERISLTGSELDQYLIAIIERAGTRVDPTGPESQPRLAPPEGTTNGSVAH